MAMLGEAIDIDSLVEAAKSYALVREYLTPEELLADESIANTMFASLGQLAVKTLCASPCTAAFSELLLAQPSPYEPVYSEVISGTGAGALGKFAGLCNIFIDEPVVLDESKSTHVIPALELEIKDFEVDDVELGVAQLFPRVAVPLMGQITTLYSCRFAV